MLGSLLASLALAQAPALPSWQAIDTLLARGQTERAAEATARRLEAARTGPAPQDVELARALARLSGLALQRDPREAVAILEAQPRPKSPAPRAVVELAFATALGAFLEANHWRLGARERIETSGPVALEQRTVAQLEADVERALAAAWEQREALGRVPHADFADVVDRPSTPEGAGDTLRDAVTLLWARHLTLASRSSPERQAETRGVAFDPLLSDEGPATPRHPLERAIAALAELERWHRAEGRRDAALVARVERLRMLDMALGEPRQPRLRDALLERIEASADLPLSAWARALAADWLERSGDRAGARDVAAAGARAFPQTQGGRSCQALAARLEAPSLRLEAPRADGPRKRSLVVRAANLTRAFFRAVPLDARGLARGPGVMADGETLRRLLRRKPVARWSVDLPATPDLAEHRTHVTPPLDAPGAYLVAASTLESFAERDNLILGVVFIVTDLVMTTTGLGGAADVIVRSGATGAPVAGVEVTLYEDPYERPPRVAQRVMTDAAGHARLEDPANPESDHFIVAKKGASLALDPRSPDLWVDHPTRDTESALLWTDRAVYRPGQTVHWKAVSWGAGPGRARAAGAGDDLGVRPGVPLTVSLLDANTVTAATTTVTTNAFGSASGTFTIPRGRGLGRWTLTASGAWQTIRVEEYKRPTFEVSFVDTKGALALGAKVTVRGEARSLFGLPVSAGLARWRVRREPVYPWWYGWWSPPREEPLVAAGVTPLSTDGSFALDFTPALDATKPADVAYRFVVEVDVTREGGETRSASRVVTLGVRSVQASFSADDGFLTEGRPATVKVRRATLDGEGRAGAGTWRLLALTPPAAPVMWDDEAPAPNPFAPRPQHTTPGDEQPPRAGAGPDVGATLRRWPDGRPVASGPLRHDATGEALVPLPPLTAGAYRLRYATVDEAGGAVEVATELVVAGPSAFPLAVPAWLRAERATSEVGSTARFLVGSAFPGQPLLFEVFRGAELVEQRWLVAGRDPAIVERPTTREDRGGFTVRVSLVRDWLVGSFSEAVSVPWSDAQLSLELSSFRDTLTPGATQRFTVVVKRAGQRLGAGGAELLASMYDRSLDAITPFEPPRVSALRRERGGPRDLTTSVEAGDALVLGGLGWDQPRASGRDFDDDDGGRGRPLARRFTTIQIIKGDGGGGRPTQVDEETGARLRATFAETAFFTPHLEVNERGEASFEVPVPDSVTGWALWVSAVTKDLAGGELRASARSVKALMVRPSLPRFLREGDAAALKVVVDNASAKDLTGEVRVALLDPATQRDVSAEFGVSGGPLPFSAKAGQGAAVTVPLVAPRRVGEVLVKVVATSGDTSDGELHTLPLLPSRLRQSPSRLVALEGASTRTLSFEAAAGGPDPSRVDEQLVVTVDAQLLASVLAALPYLARYPYECTEQTLNRFLSASLVASALRGRPALARLAADLAKRKTPLERFDAPDPNLALGLEETPWLLEARGGDDGADVARLLDPDVVERERVAALRKLEGMQLDSGAFAWFAGGPASPDMTLYLLRGLARASEAGAEMPRYMVSEAWRFLSAHWRDEASRCLPTQRCDLAFVTALAHAATAFPDASWLAGGLRTDERRALLDYAMKHEGQLTPYLRGLLALALSRSRRGAEARQVFDAVMATARTTPDDGTFWPPPARPWVWHQDPIESHAFALRVLLELAPKDPRRAGLVKWLLLRKQLGHWKSTRATAEAIAALVEYLKTEQALEMREETTVTVGASTRQLIFEPGEVTGRRQQVVVPGSDLAGARWPTVTVSKATPGLQFAAATWHFSTERLPETGDGDLLQVRRTYFKRDTRGGETTLQPLAEGARLEPGDQLEVHLTLRARQEAEYLHLRDPRGAGFEPEVSLSRHRYEAGLSWYEEVRDSGTNFFLERVPAGEFTLRYRLRAAMGGTFRVGPATLQSIYAPEFSASSAGQRLVVGTGGR